MRHGWKLSQNVIGAKKWCKDCCIYSMSEKRKEMECKVFHGGARNELQDRINQWLATHPIVPESLRVQLSTVLIEDMGEYRLEHTVILLYVPQV